MRPFSTLPLRRQLFLAIFLLFVPLFAAVLWSGWTSFRERAAELGEQAQTVARTIATFVNRDVAELDGVAQRLSREPGVRALDAEITRALFARALQGRPAVLRLELASADGQTVMSLDANGSLDTVAWADAVTTAERAVVPSTSPGARRRYVVIAYPVRDANGHAVGALGMFVNLSTLQEVLASVPLADGSSVTIATTGGRVLVSSGADPSAAFLTPGSPGSSPDEPRRERGGDGVERMYAEASADVGPWLVSVGLPLSVAFNRAVSLWSRNVVILALAVGSWLYIALVLSNRLSMAVGQLDSTAQRIASGDFSPIARQRMFAPEFEELQNALDAMLRRFNATRTKLDAQMAEERRIRLELESLQGQVIRQERLAAVGQLVSGVAHEINNPLQAISGFAELLQLQRDLPGPVQNDLNVIQRESARACAIIRNLAMFARQQPGPAALLRLTDVIAAVVELRQRRLESEQIELRVDDQSRQLVMAVLTELQQVVLNFVVNAEQAILTSGRVPGRVTIRAYDRDGRVVLEVEDTGPGVKTEDEDRLFEPFFTTKPVGQGTGLGLSISYGIIESLGGTIGYRPAPASGAIFYFELPADAA